MIGLHCAAGAYNDGFCALLSDRAPMSRVLTPVSLERFVGPPLHSEQGGGGIVIHEGTFDPDLVIPVHVHDAPVISLIVRGVASEQVSEGARELLAQDLILTPAYAPHAYTFREPGRWVNMQFSAAWLSRVSDGQTLVHTTSQFIRNHSAAAWASRIHAEIHTKDALSTLAIDGAMMLM